MWTSHKHNIICRKLDSRTRYQCVQVIDQYKKLKDNKNIIQYRV